MDKAYHTRVAMILHSSQVVKLILISPETEKRNNTKIPDIIWNVKCISKYHIFYRFFQMLV